MGASDGSERRAASQAILKSLADVLDGKVEGCDRHRLTRHAGPVRHADFVEFMR
jgi:hypothetical protein